MQIKQIDIAGTRGYQFDNFYENPEFILNHIISTPPRKTGINLSESNGVYYEDMRHQRYVPKLKWYEDVITETIGGVENTSKEPALFTNFMKWNRDSFNSYKTHYWYPHFDTYWTFILYLNPTEKNNGTNIYKPVDNYWQDVQTKTVEHITPWHPKEHYEVVDYFEPVFNRGYAFQSSRLLHGAAVNDETYFDDVFRLNQVIFFQEKSNA